MIVGAQEIVHALRRAIHVVIRLTRRMVPLIMLARPRQACELAMHRVFRLRSGGRIGGVERERWRSRERRAHQRDRSEHIGPQQRAPPRDWAAEIMTDDGVDGSVA